jgi:TetR/AcrR family transcriptional regulator, regulator of cefoperazone and chloramphenicol sensitivity
MSAPSQSTYRLRKAVVRSAFSEDASVANHQAIMGGLVSAVGYVEKMDSRRTTDDLTARARIRDSAFRLIATEGARGATLRAIAKEAGVSSPLVLHHFGSKQGVIEAVEEWVQTQLRAATADDGDSADPSTAHARRTEEFAALMSAEPLLRSYIRRMLLESSDEGLDLFSRMVTDGAGDLRRRAGSGMARPVEDVATVAAVISLMALGPVLLPDHLVHVLGEEALERWNSAVSDLLSAPLYPGRASREAGQAG